MAISLISGSWNDITAFNYAIDPIALRPFAPIGTELDFFEDQTYLSVVALNFERPTLFSTLPALLHPKFPMITFRFYVKRRLRDGSYRHGTVFLKQFAPLTSVAMFAHALGKKDLEREAVAANIFENASYLYWWGRIIDNCWIEARVHGEPHLTEPGTFEDFIFEKRWDFVPFSSRTTLQYQAKHPRWKVWQSNDYETRIDMSGILSGDIARRLMKPANSAFVAKGSRVQMSFPGFVRSPKSLKASRANYGLPKRSQAARTLNATSAT